MIENKRKPEVPESSVKKVILTIESNEGEMAQVSQSNGDDFIGRWNPRSKRHVKKKTTVTYLLRVICASREKCLDWLKNRGLIPRVMFCPNCSHKMKFERNNCAIDGFVWACKECPVNPPQFSVRHGSWLEGRDRPLVDVLLFTYFWAHGLSELQISKECNMPLGVVKEWSDTYLNICESVNQRRLEMEVDNVDGNIPDNSSKESSAVMWRRKNKYKDPFLEFLKDADSF